MMRTVRTTLAAAIVGLASMPARATSGDVPVTHAKITQWAAAWNSHDIKTVLALFDRSVEIDQPDNSKPLDYNGARKFFSMIFKAYPDFHVTVRRAIVDGRWAVSIEQVTGTWSGPFVDPNTGKVTPGNRRRFDHPGAMVLLYDPWPLRKA